MTAGASCMHHDAESKSSVVPLESMATIRNMWYELRDTMIDDLIGRPSVYSIVPIGTDVAQRAEAQPLSSRLPVAANQPQIHRS